jgi:hypothetical protein
VIYRIVSRAVVLNKRWKEREQDVRQFVEKETGEKIEFAGLFLCSTTMDFRNALRIWIALTSNHMAYAIVEQAAMDEEGWVVFSKRSEVTMTMIKQRKNPIVELVISKEGLEPSKLMLLLMPNQYESLGRYFKI